jgi:alpha-N-arabinofuranosidase
MSRPIIRALAVLTLSLATLHTPAAEPVTLTVQPDEVLNTVDEKVYAHFLEHIYHSVNGGLWGDLVWDRSFEGGGNAVAWKIDGDCAVQEGMAADVRLTFGDAKWKDYEFTLEARKAGGGEGFLILLRVLDKKQFYWANLGGWQNAGHALERGIKGEDRWRSVSKRHDGQIEENRWYRIRARCEGPHIQVWLDDAQVIDYTDDGKGPAHGRPGIGTWATQAQFRKLKVTDLAGHVLFEGLPNVPTQGATAPGWQTFGTAKVSVVSEGALNGAKCRRIEAAEGETGLIQTPMAVREGETCRGSLWARGEAREGLVVRLLDGTNVLAEKELSKPKSEWKEFEFKLKPKASCENASLVVALRGAGNILLDQVSLMPESWRKDGGFRPDLLKAIADLRPPLIRWPGGCYAEQYRWQDGIGPQHKRGRFPISMWDDVDVNSYGTDEFIEMCRELGIEPLLVINGGRHDQETPRAAYIQEACDWIEYCNGPANSKWGKIRAENGHPEPYRVKYWEIDNETWSMGAEAYADLVEAFAPAMKKTDPGITLLMCGGAGVSNAFRENWNATLIKRCASLCDYLSIHHYENPAKFAEGPLAFEKHFQELAGMIAASANTKLKLFVSEWNAQSTDWRTGLYAGGLLNAFERSGGTVGMASPALFLRHVSATGWDNAFINFDHRTWFPAPNYVVMKLWRDHYAPQRVALKGEAGPLNAVATKTEDGKALVFKAVNPTDQPVPVRLIAGERFARGKAALQVVAPGALNARNDLDSPAVVQAVKGEIRAENGAFTFTLPPFSAGAARIEGR